MRNYHPNACHRSLGFLFMKGGHVIFIGLVQRWRLLRTVYKVKQAVYESAQVFTQKHWKRSFTLSLSGVESTVASLSLDPLRSFQSCRLLFLSAEFLLRIQCWLYFYLGSFSYTSHADFNFLWGVSLTQPTFWLLSLIWEVSLTHLVLA